MPNPQLGDDWEQQLTDLKPNWDDGFAEQISASAIATLRRFHVVPRSHGGLQLKTSRDGFDIKIEIAASGEITAAVVAKEQ